jgi:hypothetical protein
MIGVLDNCGSGRLCKVHAEGREAQDAYGGLLGIIEDRWQIRIPTAGEHRCASPERFRIIRWSGRQLTR